MKKTLLIIILCISSLFSIAQKTIKTQTIKKINGEKVDITKVIEHDAPVIISIWASWCNTSVKELNAINKQIKKWKKETGVKFIAISEDKSKGNAKLENFIKDKKWDFEIYRDENQKFKNSMNIKVLPHTLIIENGKIVWENSSFNSEDIEKIHEHIKLLTFGEDIH